MIYDLINTLTKDQDKDIYIILAGEFNEAVSSSNTPHKLAALGLTNIILQMINNPPRAYKYGNNCIDHIYIFSCIFPTITALVIAPFNYYYESDHRAIYLDLHIHYVLDNETTSGFGFCSIRV